MAERRSIPRRAFIATLISSLPLSSCVLRRAEEGQEDDTDLFTLEIVNHHQLNVVIYNVAHGRHERIGEVTAAMDHSFTLHVNRFSGGEIQLFADPIGERDGLTSEIVHVLPGQTVEWRLETDLARSFLSVRD